MTQRYVCIHGHFYQPPRENAWSEIVERQPSAAPHHDWNERITAECYRPNAAAELREGRRVVEIVNNYAWISFNFGPTLLSWLENHDERTYQAVLEGDRASQAHFDGHGSAMAQAYNHMILPLANGRDQNTQVVWGIRDFRHRFGRPPEGMWLPETAVNTASLEALARNDIRFCVLAPRQARRVRPSESANWMDVTRGDIDPRQAYRCALPSGRQIALFFYDAPISQAVAFERLLSDGKRFADRLASGFSERPEHPQLVHVATDGETYGHHHRFGDMALAHALRVLQERGDVRLVNYALFLEAHPPDAEVEIAEPTSWSCAHGVERWRSDCGCSDGGHRDWTQAWRAPLREALDLLRDRLAGPYETRAAQHLVNAWQARDDYISVLLDRSPDAREAFLARHARAALDPDARREVMRLLEMQRHLMLMYTSCGWFFDDLSRIETRQILQYAARAIDLAQQVLGLDLRGPFLERLTRARSNLPEHGTGRDLFEREVETARRPARQP